MAIQTGPDPASTAPDLTAIAVPAPMMDLLVSVLRAGGLTLRLTRAAAGRPPRYLLQQAVDPTAGHGDGVQLLEREFQVLVGMSLGQTNAQIGKPLGLTVETVKTHARKLFGKLGARDRAHAVAIAYQRGILKVGGAS